MSFACGREIFKRAILNNAAKIILAHNHPSGNSTPSEDDKKTAKFVKEAGELLDINLIENMVVGDDEYCSFKRIGEL